MLRGDDCRAIAVQSLAASLSLDIQMDGRAHRLLTLLRWTIAVLLLHRAWQRLFLLASGGTIAVLLLCRAWQRLSPLTDIGF